jgi:four helix bundle protein
MPVARCQSFLNLAEGSAKPSPKERARYYRIALGSFRECSAILELPEARRPDLDELTDSLARHLYKLCKALEWLLDHTR